MYYDKNYRGQFFKDDNGPIDFKQLFDFAFIKEMNRRDRPKRPKSNVNKLETKVCLAVILVGLLSTGITYLMWQIPVISVLIFMGFGFLLFAAMVWVYAVDAFIMSPKRCTREISARCIGYSITSASDDGAGGGGRGFLRCPVFEYEYNEKEYTAYDAVYERRSDFPTVGSIERIHINPNEPEELVWLKKKDRSIFIFFFAIAFTVMGIGLCVLAVTYDDFRKEPVRVEESVK